MPADEPETDGPSANPRPAVIVGLDCITGLQSARILARRGIPVIGLAADRRHYCARTRLPQRIVSTPTAGADLVRTLERLAPKLDGPAFLLPCTDAAVLTISAAREQLPPVYRFVLPDHETVETLMDKVRFAELAGRLGLPIPRTCVVRDRADAVAAADHLPWPAVVKPGLKSPRWFAHTKAKALVVRSPAEFLEVVERALDWSAVLIAQEWVAGDESDLISFNGYFDRASEPRATFIARKLRQWPPETGTSCLGQEVRDDVVLDASLHMFGAVAYRGLAYLEMKRDRRTGQAYIIEPNIGRPTGRSAIAEMGGVELLLTAYHDALDQPLPDSRTQTYRGVKWIYWRHDLQAAVHAMMRRRLTPLGWWRSVRGPKFEAVFDRQDPMPFVGDLVHTFGAALTAVRHRVAG